MGDQRRIGDPDAPFLRVASDPRWWRLKDAMYSMILSSLRSPGAPRSPTDGLAAPLRRLEVPTDAAEWVEGAVFDMGTDLGRHLLSKPITRDDIAEALTHLALQVSAAGLGELELSRTFHRTAHVAYRPPKGTPPPAERRFRNLVAGILHGGLSEVFNCRVAIEEREDGILAARLAEGRTTGPEEGPNA